MASLVEFQIIKYVISCLTIVLLQEKGEEEMGREGGGGGGGEREIG